MGNNYVCLEGPVAVKIAPLGVTILNIYTILNIQRTSQRTDPVLRSKAFAWLSNAELAVACGLALDLSRPRVTERVAQFERERLLVVRQWRQLAVHVNQPGKSTNMCVA
jgi:hypothetical protein